VVLWDSISSGRIARGERWDFAKLENEVRIRTVSGGSVLERYEIGKDAGVGLVRGWDYVGTFYVIGDGVPADVWHRVEQRIAEVLESRKRLIGGVSEPATGGRVVKIMAGTAPDFQEAFEAVWGVARRELWGLSVPELRRY
jgi:urease accessory protein